MPRPLGTYPHVTDYAYLYRRPLKYQKGDEAVETLVASANVVPLDASGRRLLPAGTVLVPITSGPEAGKYGPYEDTADDGREILAAGSAYVLTESHDVTFGDTAVGGYYMDCVFDLTQVADEGAAGTPIVKAGATLAALEAAFPHSVFK